MSQVVISDGIHVQFILYMLQALISDGNQFGFMLCMSHDHNLGCINAQLMFDTLQALTESS